MTRVCSAVGIAVLIALIGATVVGPRLTQLGTATTSTGRATLLVIGVLLGIAAVTPTLALFRGQVWRPVFASLIALVLGTVMVLSFNERGGSDGLFVLALGLGSAIILASAVLATHHLRRSGR
jgi:hypothetical protein